MTTLPVRRKARLSGMARREALTFYICISPWLIGFLVFVAYPIVRSLYLSFTHYQIGGPPGFTGLDNFTPLAHDINLSQSLKGTALYVPSSVTRRPADGIGIRMLL